MMLRYDSIIFAFLNTINEELDKTPYLMYIIIKFRNYLFEKFDFVKFNYNIIIIIIMIVLFCISATNYTL